MGLTASKAMPEETKSLPHRFFLGVDIGGTTLSVAVVNEHGALCGPSDPEGTSSSSTANAVDEAEKHKARPVSTEALGSDHDPRSMADRVNKLAEAALKAQGKTKANIAGLGVCTPGLIDVKKGIVRTAANLKGWVEVPLCDIFAEVLALDRSTVFLENDTNAALLAEVWIGAAQGRENAVLMTLGTGIGASMMCDGRLLRGSRGQAGEIGHAILIPDGREWGTAGVKGIFESYASASAVAVRAREACANGGVKGDGAKPSSALSSMPSPECSDVFRLAQEGDELAKSIVDDVARCLAIGAINCSRFTDPDIILFAGGMAQAGEYLLQQVRQWFAHYHWNIEPIRVVIAGATLGAHAGVVGSARAAALALDACPS